MTLWDKGCEALPGPKIQHLYQIYLFKKTIEVNSVWSIALEGLDRHKETLFIILK